MNGIMYQKEKNVGVIKFNRPKVLNSLDTETILELINLLTELEEDKELRCLILTGEGRAFCCGADINEEANLNVVGMYMFSKHGIALTEKMEKFKVPIIAAINGYCLGGGAEFALACDYRMAADTALIGCPEINLGVFPGWGGTQRLARIVGISKAKEIIFTGDKYTAEDCLRIGLVDKVFKVEDLMTEAMNFAHKIASKPPLAIYYAKTALQEGAQCDLQRGMQIDAAMIAQLFSTEDKQEAYSAFLKKRPAKEFYGR